MKKISINEIVNRILYNANKGDKLIIERPLSLEYYRVVKKDNDNEFYILNEETNDIFKLRPFAYRIKRECNNYPLDWVESILNIMLEQKEFITIVRYKAINENDL